MAALPALLALSACTLQFGLGVEAKDTWSRSYKVTPAATLELREPNGTIHVTGGTGDQIEVSATKVAKGPNDQAAKAALADVKINESASPDHVMLDSSGPSGRLLSRVSHHVDYDIKMPRTGQVVIKATNGEILVQSIDGFVKIEAVNGDIQARGLSAGADVSAINGRVQLEFTSVGDRGIRCKTTNGQIIVSVPDDAKATIAAHVVNGAVETENLPVQKSESSHRSLNATIGGGGPEIRLDTTNGEIRLVGKPGNHEATKK